MKPFFGVDSARLLILALLVTLIAFVSSQAATSDRSVESRIEAVENGLDPPIEVAGKPVTKWTIAQRMNWHHVPALSVAVVNNYKIEWVRAWGVTEPGGNRPATPNTLFQAASISKAVAAMGVMHLIQEGKLSLDSNVNVALRTWKIRDNEFTRSKPVTLRELLSHSAITSVHGFPGYDVHAKLPTLVQVLDGVPPANTPAVLVEGIPGSRWQYSGGGYEIVQQLMLDTTGEPFSNFMRTNVLDPLGMKHSTYEQPLPGTLRANAASGTLASGAEVPGRWHVYPEMMAAGLWTTPSDLAQFSIALMNAKRGESNRVISAANGAEMLTPQIGANFGLSDGLGVFLEGEGDAARFSHEGDNEGFKATLVGYYSGHGIVVMTNSDNGLALAHEVIRAVQHEYGWPL